MEHFQIVCTAFIIKMLILCGTVNYSCDLLKRYISNFLLSNYRKLVIKNKTLSKEILRVWASCYNSFTPTYSQVNSLSRMTFAQWLITKVPIYIWNWWYLPDWTNVKHSKKIEHDSVGSENRLTRKENYGKTHARAPAQR